MSQRWWCRACQGHGALNGLSPARPEAVTCVCCDGDGDHGGDEAPGCHGATGPETQR